MLVKNLRRSRWSREIARGLILLFVWPLLLLSLPPDAAQAQSPLKSVAVLDFENTTGRWGTALGRKAADAVCLELSPEDYEVVRRDTVEKQIETLGLRKPLDRDALISLATKLDLDAIIIGRVLRADIRKERPQQAQVRVEVLVLDPQTGEYANGAVSDGLSSPRYEEVNSSVLIEEAVHKASFQAVKQLASQEIRDGTVLSARDGVALLNIGAQDGVKVGMEMIVLRQGVKVGRLVVRSTTNRDSEASIKEDLRGITSEDKARVVYSPAAVTAGGASVARSGGKRISVGKIITYALGVAALAYALKMVKSKDQKNVPATGVRACAALDGTGQPAVRVTWGRPSTPTAPHLVGFVIYRSTTQHGFYEPVGAVLGPYETQFWDSTLARTFQKPTVGDTVDNLVEPVPTEDQDAIGIQPGVTYSYRVSRVFWREVPQTDSGSGQTGTTDSEFILVESDQSEPTGPATALARPRLQSPADGETVNPSSILFRWFSVGGGDQYTLQVSDTPSFDPARTFSSPDGDSRMALPGGADNQTMSATFNISAMFPATDPQTGQSTVRNLFWRVGVRHRGDSEAPLGGWVFSDAERMSTQELPPPPVQ